jgi:hypothetical protein
MRPLRAGGALAAVAAAALLAAIPASASVATLQPAGITTSEQFGHSVAISGTTIAVGAPSAGPDGVVYVFTETGGSWSNPPAVATISNPDPAQPPEIGTQFGTSVALAGNQLFVADNGIGTPGSVVWEFDRPAGAWADTSSPDGTLGPPDAMSDPNSIHRHFGAIAASGTTLIVGDPGCFACGGVNQDQPVSGEAFVYTAATDGWGDVDGPVETLTQPAGNGDDSGFGTAVGISGDQAAVGSPSADTAAGGVFVYGASGSNWAQASPEALLSPSIDDNTQGAEFGAALAMSPAGIAVGAPSWTFSEQLNGEPVTLLQAGGVWAFDAGAGGRYSNASAIALEAGDSSYESLGTSVGISGHLLVYGGPTPTAQYESGDVIAGTAGGLFESPFGWNGADVSSPDLPYGYCCGANVDDDEFGDSVAIAGTTEVVGMPSTSTANIPGAAYVSTGAAPSISIEEPGNGSSTSAATAAVNGTIDFAGSLDGVAVNGVAATVTGDDYTATVPLKPGKNTVTATVTTTDAQTASASITVTSTATPPPPPKQGSPSLPRQVQQVAANGSSSIEISCSGAGACSGSIIETVGVLNGKAVTARASKRPKRVVIGRASFSRVAAGKRKSVTLKLNAAGRHLLAKARGKLNATITIEFTGGGHKHTKTSKIKLRSTKHARG